jgi:hypothetical protein
MSLQANLPSELEVLKQQLVQLNAELKEVASEMIQHNFTELPIFVAHQENAQIGEVLFDRTEFGFQYSLNATTIERLIELNVIQPERLTDYKKAYGDPKKNYCVLWLSGENTRFIFMPFK